MEGERDGWGRKQEERVKHVGMHEYTNIVGYKCK